MNTGPARSGTPAPAHATADAAHDERRVGGMGSAADRDPALLVPVEEIFLEGCSMTMLRHEAGSTRTVVLLETADLPALVARSPAATG